MCTSTTRCAAWLSLESVGLPHSGCLHSPGWLQRCIVPSSQSIMNPSVYVSTPHETLRCIKTVFHGTFGYIDWATYDNAEGRKGVYCKRPILAGRSLLLEACIQQLVGETLASIGFQTGAPRVLRVFRLREESVCFAMEPIEGAITLDSYLASLPVSCLPNVLVDCLLQLCAMIWHLNNHVGINHRDLKPSNFLVVEHEPRSKLLLIENEMMEIVSRCTLTLIDFGFSCLGSLSTRIANVSLSTVYPPSDPCPKDGRDLFLLLGILYIDYYGVLPAQLLALFESWLQEPGSTFCRFLRLDKESSKRWLYFMIGNDTVTRFPSLPLRMVQDLQAFLAT